MNRDGIFFFFKKSDLNWCLKRLFLSLLIGKYIISGTEHQVTTRHDIGASLRSAPWIETTEKQDRDGATIRQNYILMDNVEVYLSEV